MKTYTLLRHPGERLQAVAHDGTEGRAIDHAGARSLLYNTGRHPTPEGVVAVAILLDATKDSVFALDHYEAFHAGLLSQRASVTEREILEWTFMEFVI